MSDHIYVLHARAEGGEVRHMIHLCDDEQERVEAVMELLRLVDTQPPSTAHVRAVCNGTHHPIFPKALQQLNMTWSKGCDQSTTDRAAEMLVAAAMVPPVCVDDYGLHSALTIAFSTDEDWELMARSAQQSALAFLTYYEQINADQEAHTMRECMMVTQLAAAICVAMTQARAEWSRRARGGDDG